MERKTCPACQMVIAAVESHCPGCGADVSEHEGLPTQPEPSDQPETKTVDPDHQEAETTDPEAPEPPEAA